MRETYKSSFRNKIIFLILAINLIALLATLSNNYTDGYNLRQAQTAIMTRNIFYDNFNIFPTRLTFFAPFKGNTIFEFPFIHFLTALTYKISISEINGRLINLTLHLLNGFIFYKIQNLIFKNSLALILTTLFISSPLIFYLAHAFMPETSMLTFYLLSYYFFIKSKFKNNIKNKSLMFISLAIGPIIKPPAGIIYLPIFLDLINKKDIKILFKISFFLCISATPLLLWMIYANYINSTELSNYGNWLNIVFGKGEMIKTWFDFNFYKNISFNFLFLHLNPLTFFLSISAFILTFKSKDNLIIFHRNWIFTNLVFLFLLPGANRGHPYYQIYFIPPLLFFIGIFFSDFQKHFLKKNLLINYSLIINLFLSIAVFTYGSNQTLRIPNLSEFKSVVFENINIDKNISNEYILFSHENLASTAVFTYYADSYSKQFHLSKDNISTLEKEIHNGAKYIFFINTNYGDTLRLLKANKNIYNWLNINKEKLYESDSIILYKLH